MKFEDLKQKAVAAKRSEEAQAAGRQETDKMSDAKRAEFQRAEQQKQVAGAVENLQKARAVIETFRQSLENLVNQTAELQGKRGKNQKKLTDIYGKISEILKDEDIQRELVSLGKNVQDAESLITDPDFSEEAGVSEALVLQNALAELEQKLIALENDERQLYTKIQTQTGAQEEIPEELTAARAKAQKSLEHQIGQLDKEIKVLELHTPEGQKKAEDELDKLLERKDTIYGIENRDRLTRQVLSEDLIGPQTLQYKEILGDEKFMEIVRRHYDERVEAYVAAYKKAVELDTWERDFKRIENYPVQLERSSEQLSNLYKRKKEIAQQLKQFFLSEQGRDAFLQVAKTFWPDSTEQSLAYNDKAKELNAEQLSSWFVEKMESLAYDFSVDKQYDWHEEQGYKPSSRHSILQEFSQRMNSANENFYREQYEQLLDLEVLQVNMGKVNGFYDNLAEKIQDPESLVRVVLVADASEQYVHKGKGEANRGTGIKSSLERPYMNSYWGNVAGNYKQSEQAIKEFVALMPDFDVRKMGTLPLETKGFNAKSYSGEYVRKRKKQELADLNKFIEKLKAVTKKKADRDVAQAEVAAFEHSPKFPEAKVHMNIQRQQETIKQLLLEIMAVQQAVDAERPISLQEQKYRDEVTVYVKDSETEVLNKRQGELNSELNKKEEELRYEEYQGRPSLLSGKRGAWDKKVVALRQRIVELKGVERDKEQKGEIRLNQEKQEKLKPIHQGLHKLAQILNRVAEELPQNYKLLRLAESATAGQIYEKLIRLAKDVADLKATGDQIAFAKEYENMRERVQKLNGELEKVRANLGVHYDF